GTVPAGEHGAGMKMGADRTLRALGSAVCCLASALPPSRAAADEPFIVRVSGPRYPPPALVSGVVGTAECALQVSPSGTVTGVELNAADFRLEEEARTAALGFRS